VKTDKQKEIRMTRKQQRQLFILFVFFSLLFLFRVVTLTSDTENEIRHSSLSSSLWSSSEAGTGNVRIARGSKSNRSDERRDRKVSSLLS
jgi:hypothetical protein